MFFTALLVEAKCLKNTVYEGDFHGSRACHAVCIGIGFWAGGRYWRYPPEPLGKGQPQADLSVGRVRLLDTGACAVHRNAEEGNARRLRYSLSARELRRCSCGWPRYV